MKKESSSLKDTMIQRETWLPAPDDEFPASRDGVWVKEAKSSATDEARTLNHSNRTDSIGDSVSNGFCAERTVFCEKADVSNNNHLYNISHSDNELSFIGNDPEEKERSDFLYCGWPDDVGNFEDVDRVFCCRSCDSTFGLGSLTYEDNLYWFSSPHSAEVSEDATKFSSQVYSSDIDMITLNGFSELHELSGANELNCQPLCIDDNLSSRTSSAYNCSALGQNALVNDSNTKSSNLHEKQSRDRNKSEGKPKDQNMGSANTLHQDCNIKLFEDPKYLSGDSPRKVPSTPSFTSSHPLTYVEPDGPFVQMDHGVCPDQISVSPGESGNKYDIHGQPSSSLKESSPSCAQVQSVESTLGSACEGPAVMVNDNKGLHRLQDSNSSLPRNFNHANLASPVVHLSPVKKQVLQPESVAEGHSEIMGVSSGNLGEIDSSHAQDSSCITHMFDEISQEATSFWELQQVVEKLDVKTKLFIRDSLYRLAKSAQQRQNGSRSYGGKRERDVNGMLLEETKSAGFADMETDTNPIDRSIAHLLFYQPLDSSIIPPDDPLPVKSHTMVHESSGSPSETI